MEAVWRPAGLARAITPDAARARGARVVAVDPNPAHCTAAQTVDHLAVRAEAVLPATLDRLRGTPS